jgi:hypothetical protein
LINVDSVVTGITRVPNDKYSKGWTEKKIQYVLYNNYAKTHKYCCRNKYLFSDDSSKFWESDWFMMKNGLTYEDEIKCHSTDVAKEQSVKGKKHEFFRKVYESKGQYLLKEDGSPKYYCPNYYVFVCQEGLIEVDYVRENYPYAGLRWITDDGKIKTKINKKLHPIKQDMTERLLNKFYWNSSNLDYWSFKLANGYKHLGDDPKPKDLKNIIENFIKETKLRYV